MKTKTRSPPATVTEIVTIVLVGFETVVTTLPGQTIPVTQVITSLETQTVTATPTPGVNNAAGFTPVNSAPGSLSPAPLLVSTLLVWFMVYLSLLGPYPFLAAG
ncbi:hypothetical protein PENSPDRAFT_645131 [Peniophora sp. CONT]|nr:hypothetical protein PENSPDRAFT_645131 [Peniophora sp. CONT]